MSMVAGKAWPRIIMIIALALAAFLIYRHRETARLNNQAVVLIGQQRYAEALEKLEIALERDPDNELVQGNIEKARKALQEQSKQ